MLALIRFWAKDTLDSELGRIVRANPASLPCLPVGRPLELRPSNWVQGCLWNLGRAGPGVKSPIRVVGHVVSTHGGCHRYRGALGLGRLGRFYLPGVGVIKSLSSRLRALSCGS